MERRSKNIEVLLLQLKSIFKYIQLAAIIKTWRISPENKVLQRGLIPEAADLQLLGSVEASELILEHADYEG